jgi:hypothetical protein
VPVRRNSSRLVKNKATPVATNAEKLCCQRMGILVEGEKLTEAAAGKFVKTFNSRPSIDALCTYFSP